MDYGRLSQNYCGALLGNAKKRTIVSAWQTANNGGTNRASYGYVAISSQVYQLGGEGFSLTRTSGLVEAGGTVASVNATPGDLALGRELMGTTLGAGRIFVVGGDTAGGVTDAVESSVW